MALMGAALTGCRQSVPDTTVAGPLELQNGTIDVVASPTTPGAVLGKFDPTPPHTSVNVDPAYLVFEPAAATLTIPIASASLTSGAAPPDVTLSSVRATLSLEDPQSAGPIDYPMTGTPGTWTFQRGAGSSYDAATALDLTLTLTDPNTVRGFVDVLTTGGDNTTRIVIHADSGDLGSGDTLRLTFGRDSVVFSY